ncbi:MAG TPA: TolC family protein [Planctomycetes bacterium]|nr:TolC family protein [Fuerstiella sp.]HIK93614.1 TolC family protein [Planctomycetota bacterium]
MRSATIKACFLGGLICLSGCSSVRNGFAGSAADRPARPAGVEVLHAAAESPFEPASTSFPADRNQAVVADDVDSAVLRTPGESPAVDVVGIERPRRQPPSSATPRKLVVTPVGHEIADDRPESDGTITVDGRTYEIRLVDQQTQAPLTEAGFRNVRVASQQIALSETPFPGSVIATASMADEVVSADVAPPDAMLLNLPSALSMIGGDHPAVGFAQWKVQEAYANLDQAEVLWLPSIQTGFSFHRHDGNLQASDGSIVDVNRSSFQYGLGAGAVGAGTTPRPGISAQFHLADAIFQPDISRKTAWATCHAEKAVVNRQLRDVALAYLKMLDAHQQLRILQEVKDRTAAISKITDDFAGAGQGLQADADRMRTELRLIEGRIAAAHEQVDVTSARLAYALSVNPGQRIIPLDPTVVPIELVSTDMDEGSLITSGLSNRPELKELQALVAAACDRHRRQKYAPFIPSVLLGFSTGGFGGGLGNVINNVDNRYDFDAMVTWEIRNFGFGERSARRRSQAQVQQAMFRKLSLIDDVAREIAEAYTQVTHRRERMAVTQTSIRSAQDSYDRNLSRIREGEGLPIEVLQSVKALEASRRAYLDSVSAFNEAQFQLQWALGWQVSAPQ